MEELLAGVPDGARDQSETWEMGQDGPRVCPSERLFLWPRVRKDESGEHPRSSRWILPGPSRSDAPRFSGCCFLARLVLPLPIKHVLSPVTNAAAGWTLDPLHLLCLSHVRSPSLGSNGLARAFLFSSSSQASPVALLLLAATPLRPSHPSLPPPSLLPCRVTSCPGVLITQIGRDNCLGSGPGHGELVTSTG